MPPQIVSNQTYSSTNWKLNNDSHKGSFFQDQAMYVRTSLRGANASKLENRVYFWSQKWKGHVQIK